LGQVLPLRRVDETTLALVENPELLYRRCANAESSACNWLVPLEEVEAGHELCRSCRLNRTIPNLTAGENAQYWASIEQAKRRLVSGLLVLGLPVQSKVSEDPECGLAFDFLENPEDGSRILTGHDGGIITLNIAEANDATRENIRTQMHEPYRTLLGHLRHESGHYYWDRLVEDSPSLDAFRNLFGDDRVDYAGALEKHYAEGPPSNWALNFVSAYASSHPWEDWAETWAHYLHMHDALETAAGFRLDTNSVELPLDSFSADILTEPDNDFLEQLNGWTRFSAVLNEFARSLGQHDFYPFILSTESARKLHFVHRVVMNARQQKDSESAGLKEEREALCL
jgi:hypothetical protein